MDKRLLLAIALSAVVVIGYQEYLRIYFPQRTKPVTKFAGSTPLATPGPAPSVPAALPSVRVGSEPSPPPIGNVTVETPIFRAVFSSRGARLVSLKLKDYRTSVDAQSPPLEVVSAGTGSEYPLGVVLRGEKVWTDRDVEYAPSAYSATVREDESVEVVFAGALDTGAKVEKHIRFQGDKYAFTVGVGIAGTTEPFTEAALAWTRVETAAHSRYHYEGSEALVGRKLLRLTEKDLLQGAIFPDSRGGSALAGSIQWAGYADTYFLSAVAPRDNDPARLWVKLEEGVISTEVLVPIAATKSEAYPFTVYTGPKDLHILAEAGHHLERSVDLGWFGFVAEPMLRVIKLFHRGTGNYGLDIILLTVLIKVLFIPLTHKSFKSMQGLQKLQPQMKKLQEKLKDDREALNKEMMELYRRHNVNPLGGCLPMLFQMPIFIGLYNALLNAVELRHAPFALWINDLSAPDRLPAMPAAPLALIAGYELRIPVLTLLMGVSMLVQQKMTPAAGDPAQQRMMMLMPVVFTVMFVNFPSGLVLYWLGNNVLTIAQQMIVQRGDK